MDAGLMTFIAVGCAVFGQYFGAWTKRKSLSIIPFNDPISWLLLIVLFIILLMPDLAPDLAIINIYDVQHDAALIGFLVMYTIGYIKEEMLCEFVSTHDIFKLTQKVTPIVYYYNDRNELCWQPQKASYVLKRMLFNIDNPLDFPLDAINHRRYIEFQGRFLKLAEYCCDTAKMTITDDYVTKWKFKFKIQSCVFDPSPLNTYGPWDYYVNGKMASEIVQNYERLKIRDMNASADIAMARMNGAIEIVKGIADMKPDTAIVKNIVSDLDARNTTEEKVERANRPGTDTDGDIKRFRFKKREGVE